MIRVIRGKLGNGMTYAAFMTPDECRACYCCDGSRCDYYGGNAFEVHEEACEGFQPVPLEEGSLFDRR